ncbi:MAG TPA: 16S rRNA (uracil(1498)-N(3))-methyltransferase [Burkholderiales bacterium]|nr:16S rRNA (uracil(1498)-N(3))-methyltransferase [Burkholderiales bacterium]
MRPKPARAPRLYHEGPLQAGIRLTLTPRAAHHATHVLRLRAGEALTLFDGRGGEYDARIIAAARERVEAEVAARRDVERESPLRVTLVQAVSSGERMDLTLQKAVELGVAAIQPVLAEKTVVKLDAARAAVKAEHWRRIVIAACEQCGRNRLPMLLALTPLAEYCRNPRPGTRLLLSPGARRGLRAAAAGIEGEVVLAAGPEAGFSAAEEALLIGAGFEPVRLGPRVLRTETAALAALAALNALAGDY